MPKSAVKQRSREGFRFALFERFVRLDSARYGRAVLIGVIGDSEVDVQTARNAGMLAAAVNYGFGAHDRAAYPADVYLDGLMDVGRASGHAKKMNPAGYSLLQSSGSRQATDSIKHKCGLVVREHEQALAR